MNVCNGQRVDGFIRTLVAMTYISLSKIEQPKNVARTTRLCTAPHSPNKPEPMRKPHVVTGRSDLKPEASGKNAKERDASYAVCCQIQIQTSSQRRHDKQHSTEATIKPVIQTYPPPSLL